MLRSGIDQATDPYVCAQIKRVHVAVLQLWNEQILQRAVRLAEHLHVDAGRRADPAARGGARS